MGAHKKDGSPAAPETTGVSREIRLQEVRKMLMEAKSTPQIYEYAKEKWGIESRTVDNLIHEVKEEYAQISESDRKAACDEIIAQCNYFISQCYEKGDLRTGLAALKYKGKLFKLDVPDENTVSNIIYFEGDKNDYL